MVMEWNLTRIFYGDAWQNTKGFMSLKGMAFRNYLVFLVQELYFAQTALNTHIGKDFKKILNIFACLFFKRFP